MGLVFSISDFFISQANKLRVKKIPTEIVLMLDILDIISQVYLPSKTYSFQSNVMCLKLSKPSSILEV